MIGAVNGDFSGLDSYLNEPESTQRMEKIIAGLSELGPHLCMADGEINDFNINPCDCCYTRLHGERYEFVILG